MVLKVKVKNKGKTKYKFTCKEMYCYRHMWLCTKHKAGNQESMEAKANQLDRDHGLKLVCLLGFNILGLSIPIPGHDPQHPHPGEPPLPRQVPGPATNSKAFRTAEKKLRKKARKSSNSPVEIVPVPVGDPMFMFQALKGINNPVFGFYDSGCSNACFKTGIPGTELKGQVLAKGPFTVEGVKGVLIQAGDEWLVHLDRVDGRKQEMRGLTLEQITGSSPKFNIEEATRAVKADKPCDTILQNCSLPKVVGGSVDIMIGIQYNSIFPQPIHRLPNGLEIYQCVLASHDSSINATIGGPHSSFEALADHLGGAMPVMALFLAGLEKFKRWGPPSIQANPITLEEIEFAKSMNSVEGDLIMEELLQVERAEEYLEEVWEDKECATELSKLKQAASGDNSYEQVIITVCDCQSICPALNKSPVQLHEEEDDHGAADSGVYFADIEKISPLCKLKLLEDGGL